MLGKTPKETKPKRQDSSPRQAVEPGISVISKDLRIAGDCLTQGRLRIEGRVVGNVTARAIDLVSTGSVEGDVVALANASGKEAFVIDGAVEGAVRAAVVEVRANGTVNGGVVADEAVIHGRVRGGVLARKSLALEETAAVEGDVRATRLALKEGGQVNGTIRMGEGATTERGGEPAPPEAPEDEGDAAAETPYATAAAGAGADETDRQGQSQG